MRKGIKKLLTFATAAVMTVGALSLAACGEKFTPPTGGPAATDDVVSNGGFAVKKGEYVYFINGVESYTADNTYGSPVRGALMRIKETDVEAKKNTAETVIPSLMVAGDYDAGIFIYGDRIYYATPNTQRDTTGSMQVGYLDFKSAKLDGTDIKSYFRLENNTTPYRIVEVKDTVYIMYVTNGDLYSYNTAKKEKTLLVDNVGNNYVFNKTDKGDATVYYTMGVTLNADSDKDSPTISYNQVYRVSADTTEAPYEYEWDMDYINDQLGGNIPYTNLGEIVLDGWGTQYHKDKTQFNHEDATPVTSGYNYTLQSYQNDGIYFTRSYSGLGTSTEGEGGELYYLAEEDMDTEHSVTINEAGVFDVVASTKNTSKATKNALYYIDEEGGHHYLYVNGGTIYRADVGEEGDNIGNSEGVDQAIAYDVNGATLVSLDAKSSEDYDYVYFTRTNGAGISVERAVYNGDEVVYKNIKFDDIDNKPYQPVKVLNVEHADSWYSFEIIDTTLYFADASNTVNATSYNYINTVSLKGANGLMDNAELADFTKKYNDIMGSDKKTDLIAKLTANGNAKLATAIRYYFLSGDETVFDKNIEEAEEKYNKSHTFLYSEAEQEAFHKFVEKKGYAPDENSAEYFSETDFVDENGVSYRTYSYFVCPIGEMTKEHEEARAEYWYNAIERYYVAPEEAEGLPAWAWALIGIGIGVVVLGCAAVVVAFVLRKKKGGSEQPKQERMAVDTTDDRSVDVYAEPSEEEKAEEAPAEAPAEEVPAESAEEPTPAEESEAPVEEENAAPYEE